MESLLIITGTMGAGKTSILGEASDILALRGIVHAAIDLDALGLAHLPAAAGSDGVMYRNLQSVCENYASLGVNRLLLARAIDQVWLHCLRQLDRLHSVRHFDDGSEFQFALKDRTDYPPKRFGIIYYQNAD